MWGGGAWISHVPLSATSWNVARQFPLSMEFSRQEKWSGLPIPTPGDLSNLRINIALYFEHSNQSGPQVPHHQKGIRSSAIHTSKDSIKWDSHKAKCLKDYNIQFKQKWFWSLWLFINDEFSPCSMWGPTSLVKWSLGSKNKVGNSLIEVHLMIWTQWKWKNF